MALGGGIVLGLGIAVALLVVFWNWNWFRPLVEARASAAIGRRVTLAGLEVHLGRETVVVAHEVHIANPAGFDAPDLATANRVSITFAAETWLRTRQVVLPRIEIDQPVISARQTTDGKNNWTLDLPAPIRMPPRRHQCRSATWWLWTAPRTSLRLPRKPTSRRALQRRRRGQGGVPATRRTPCVRLMVDADGTYVGQKFTAHATGGALLTLRDNQHYPIDLTLASGATKITLKGTVHDPLNFAGADLTLMLEGQDMAQLYALTAIPTPPTPPYRVSGKLHFGNGRFRFTDMHGKVGSSDLNGDLEVDPHGARKVLSGTLMSHLVDMDDLAGFIGSSRWGLHPGRRPRSRLPR